MTTTSTHRAAGNRRPADPLTRSLAVDAVVSAGTGVLLAAGSGLLDEVLGIPPGWLLGLGLFMVVYGIDVGLVAARPAWHRIAPAIVVGNSAWVTASIVLVLGGWFDLTALGVAFVLAQAAIVAAFAVMQARAVGR
ncbi:MAG: hypothetical protein H0V93_09965 [Euzebyales bacterium]|nr:hypothetical protein [Euzebyales bacterium]